MAEAFPRDQDTPVSDSFKPLTQDPTAALDHVLNNQQYEIHVKTDDDNEEDYENTQHVISLIKNGDNPENKKMYFNHDQLHGNNFSWNDKSGITFHNGADGEFVGGHFEFNHNRTSGLGSFQQGEIRKPAKLLLKPAEFNVALSKNAGAHIEQEGIGLKLTWDTKSTAWKDAHWTEKALEYSYSVNIGPKIAGQDTYIYNATFTDPETGVEWKVDNNPGNFNGYVTVTIDENGRIVFNKNDTKQPPDPKRTDKEFPSVFPDDMVYDMNEIGTMFSGAMSFGTNVKTASVYAIQGSLNNPFILGHYMLYSKGRPQSTFAVSRGKMLVNNTPVSKSGVKHSTLWWNDLSSKHSDVTGLPTNGSIDFSKDGSNGLMFRKSTQGPLLTVKPRNLMATQSLSTTNLNIFALMAMDPNAKSKSGTTDVVQQDAMQDFYKTIQYYMDTNLRHDFINLNPPVMTDILNVAVDDRPHNSQFYGYLSVPYLAQALANSTQPGSNLLNGVRASKMINKGFLYDAQYKKTYQDQTQKFYTLRFIDHFPTMLDFLLDQKTNTKYSNLIKSDVKGYTDYMTANSTAGDALNHAISIIKNLANKAIYENLYWAYAMFRYITSPFYITWLQSEMLNPNGNSQSLAMTVKKYVTLLQILDPSGEYSVGFLNFVKQYQYLNILPQLLNLQGLTKDYTIFMQETIDAFVKKYVNSKDPNMKDAAIALKEQVRKDNLKPIMEVFHATLLHYAGEKWNVIADKFPQVLSKYLPKDLLKKIGKISFKVAEMFTMGIAVTSIVFMIQGNLKWADMTLNDKAAFVELNTILFEKVVTKIWRGVLKAKAAFIATEGSWSESLQILFTGKWDFVHTRAEYLEGSIQKWVVDTKGSEQSVADAAIKAANNAEELAQADRSIGKVEFVFGKNLDEFMATRVATIFAMVNIILSSIQLSRANTPLEKSMNSLFLSAGILELVSSVGTWTLSLVATESAETLSTIFGLVAGMSILAALVGAIILIVILEKHKSPPPTPLENFVSNEATNAGYVMHKGIDIDYFQVTRVAGQADAVGLAISEGSTSNCIRVSATKNLEIAPLDYGSDTVWEISTDQFGYAKFATFVYSPDLTQHGVFIKLKNDKVIAEGAIAGEDENEEKWICDITDNPNYETVNKTISKNNVVQKFLKSGNFTIRNVAAAKNKLNKYLNVANGTLVVSTNPKKWTLSMEGKRPDHLKMGNISIDQHVYPRKYYHTLKEPGSLNGTKWELTPTLPSYLSFNKSTGIISLDKKIKNIPDYHEVFELIVTNHYGHVSATFTIDAKIVSVSSIIF